MALNLDDLHPAVRDALRPFEVAHLPAHLAEVSGQFRDLAYRLAELDPDPELTRALHKLCEAKDCAVRAVVFKATECRE